MTQVALTRAHNRQLQVENASLSTYVPNNSVGRLMYYLKCMRDVLGDCVPAHLTDYSNHSYLSDSDRQMVIGIAREFPPEKIPLFIQVDELPGNSGNEFLRFNSIQETVTALGIGNDRARMLAMRKEIEKQQLLEVMVFVPAWARNNYYGPLREIREAELQRQRQNNQSCSCALL